TPICAAADYCGGCSLQHLSPVRQIEFKLEQLLAALSNSPPAAVMSPLVGPVRGYRTKARLGVKYVEKKERVLVGFREKMAPFIAEIDRCEVLAPPMDSLISVLAGFIGGLEAKRSIPQIEVAVGETRTALVFRHLEALSAGDLSKFSDFGKEQGIEIYLQPKGPDSTRPLSLLDSPNRTDTLLGYSLPAFGLEYEFHPLEFTQINQAINRLLVDLVVKELALDQNDVVLDLFCGIGNFTLPVAKNCNTVIGIEASSASVARARTNARLNEVDNCSFLEADLFAREPHFPPDFRANKVLLDPPRSGALEVCKRLASHKVERVVYVSCNPLTLARDAQLLVESGYRLDKAGVIDMFPHTTHVESIACFSR
ncbi:MAG: 23S rRNA (uracil(1939)-C(5))-methyltransferase RlmD, partial [Pseudomonadales bacterium]